MSALTRALAAVEDWANRRLARQSLQERPKKKRREMRPVRILLQQEVRVAPDGAVYAQKGRTLYRVTDPGIVAWAHDEVELRVAQAQRELEADRAPRRWFPRLRTGTPSR